MSLFNDASLFKLKSNKGCWEVSSFHIKSWAISDFYSIYLCIESNDCDVSISEPVSLFFDAHYFHAEVTAISYDGYQLQLTLSSPIAARLQVKQSRVYCANDLRTLVHQFLSQQGMYESIDFQLHLPSSAQKLWFFQDNESAKDFFLRIIGDCGLVFFEQQQKDNTLLIIADCMSKLPQSDKVDLMIAPVTGMVQNSELSQLSLNSQLCPELLEINQYDSDKISVPIAQLGSSHSFARGKKVYSGNYNTSDAHSLRAVEDEKAVRLKLITNKPIKPGQSLILEESPFKEKQYGTVSIDIHAQQREAKGATELLFQKELQCGRLSYHLSLSPHLSGLLLPQKGSGAQLSFRTACIEHKESAYADISKAGAYHIRLKADEEDKLDGANKYTKASFDVRNALYYAGHQYGFALPFQDKTEVIVAFENAHLSQPIILGALPNKKAISPITLKNKDYQVLSSYGGSTLKFYSQKDKRIIELSTSQDKNSLIIQQQESSYQVSLQAKEDQLSIQAFDNLYIITEGQLDIKSDFNQRYWLGRDASVYTEKSALSLEADNNASFNSKEKIILESKKQVWTAEDRIIFKSKNKTMLSANDSCSVISEQGKQIWWSQDGKIALKAKRQLTLKSSESEMTFTKDKLEIKTPGTIKLNAKEIQGLG
jgi:hypothetical protein